MLNMWNSDSLGDRNRVFYGYVVQGVCQRLQQLSWIKLLFRRFDADLVFFWAPLPVSPQRKERWKQTCLRVLTLFLLYHWYWHFGKLLLGSDGFEIQNAEMYPFFFSPPPERGSDQECLLERHHSDRRLSVQTMGERERDRGWNGVVPLLPLYWIRSEVCSVLEKGCS